MLHIFVFGTLFLYVGIVQKNMPPFMYPILLGLGIILILYHSYKGYLKLTVQKNPWVNLIHILLVGPILIYIGYKRVTPRYVYELLLMLGFAAIGYHGYYAIEDFVESTKKIKNR